MARLVRSPPPPHQHVGPHGSADGGYVLKQLTRAVSKYMARHPSLRLAANRTSTGRVCSGQFNVDKDLPPLPSGGDPFSSEDEELHSSSHSSPSNTSVSVTRPVTARSWVSQSSWLRRRIAAAHLNTGTSTSDSPADYSHFEAATPSEYYSTSSIRASSSSVVPEERSRSNPETEATILASSSTNPLVSSRISASAVVEPNPDPDASTSGYSADYRSSTSSSQSHSSSSGLASPFLTAPEEQSQPKTEAEPAPLTTPSTNPRSPLGPRLETSLNVVTSTRSSSSGSPFSTSPRASEYFTVPAGRSSWYLVQPEEGIRSNPEDEPTSVPFNRDSDPPGSKSPVEERNPVSPSSPTVNTLELDLGSDATMLPVPPSPPQKHQPPSTAKKRKRTEGHSRLLSPDLTSIPSGPSKRRKSLNTISSTSSWSPEDEAPLSPPSQSVGDSSTLSTRDLAEERTCRWTMKLTLEELFKGGEYIYRVTSRMLSGKPRIQYVQVDVMPGWAAGTRIIFLDAGDEHAPGLFQTVVFVVEQADHERFRRRECGNLVCSQEISRLDANDANGERALHNVVGLDGKVIEFYPPEGVVSPGQETVIKGEGMYQRSDGIVVGRGDLIIRWNITS